MSPLEALAELVRGEAERWARDVGYDAQTLEYQCAVTSLAFVAAAARLGLQVALACGRFAGTDPPDPHFWVFAWEDGCRIVDLTATQYLTEAPRAAILTHADPAASWYLLECIDDQARTHVGSVDAEEANVLTARVMEILDHCAVGKAA